MCLSSCARSPAQPPAPLILFPPESVFTPCEKPQLLGDTWGDALSYTLALQTSLQIYAGQVSTLTQWRTGVLGINLQPKDGENSPFEKLMWFSI
ncbi:Rz1-like lysis system protein LysC [Serratia surfactantfaciens]|uniref:Rz1-like lysis system protein LysC n=1 Tax=Serratia surfactantfaciens TaxID=2741499 RepID=UPI003EE1FE48